jgi:hypothetical protein
LANLVGPMIRNHWAIEKSLHWIMDMMFRDDECRIRTDNAPANFTTLRHMAQNLNRKSPPTERYQSAAKLTKCENRKIKSRIGEIRLGVSSAKSARDARRPKGS